MTEENKEVTSMPERPVLTKQQAHLQKLAEKRRAEREAKEAAKRAVPGYARMQTVHVHPHNGAWGVTVLTIEKGKVTDVSTDSWCGDKETAIYKAEEMLWELNT